MDISESYDSAAKAYAEHLADELARKPLDRHLLSRFAEETRGRGLVADLGCGPGHISRYLREQGVQTVGLDISPGMVEVAGGLHPGIEFPRGRHDPSQPRGREPRGDRVVLFHRAFRGLGARHGLSQMRRVLAPGGMALVAFHIGEQVVHLDDLFGAPVSLDFRFHVPEKVVEALRAAGLPVIEHAEREPYEGVEYPSRRCYLLVRAV